MRKILLYGLVAERNFGAPSIMHGVQALAEHLGVSDRLVCYQKPRPSDTSLSDFPFPLLQVPYASTPRLLGAGLLYRLGIKPRDPKKRQLLEDIRQAEVIINLYGILFCDNLQGKYGHLLPVRVLSILRVFTLSLIGRLFGRPSVKSPASYGPMDKVNTRREARLSARWAFTQMFARETESQRQLQAVTPKGFEAKVLPDLANYWDVQVDKTPGQEPLVGISVSHQIIRQWQSEEGYEDCIRRLIRHVRATTGARVVLIPNEFPQRSRGNDIDTAAQILQDDTRDYVSVAPVEQMSATQIKQLIKSCEVIIASRYHSCVAALSSGVPVMTLGWHYKYQELLAHYQQERWLLSHQGCTAQKLMDMFDAFWASREAERQTIQAQRALVRQRLEVGAADLFPGHGTGTGG